MMRRWAARAYQRLTPLLHAKHFRHPLWRSLLKTLFYALVIGGVVISVLLYFALDNSPQPIVYQGLNRDDIQRAKQLLNVPVDERDQIKNISLSQKDLNIAISYLLSHFVENTPLIQILPEKIRFQIAIFVPRTPWGRYLDLSFSLWQLDEAIRIKSLKIGTISIPDPVANTLIDFAIHHTALTPYWQTAQHYIKAIRITPASVEVSYLGELVDAAKQLAQKKHSRYPSLHIYQQQINDIVSHHNPAWRLSLSDLLHPLFQTAYQRSTPDTAIQENRAVIIALASYLYKNELRHFLPIGLVYSKELPVFAYKRIDIPQHFIAAALLVAVNSSQISQTFGVNKELGDAEHGSGFSFIDLAADRTGTQFGRLAIASPQQAYWLQQQLAGLSDYQALIPNYLDLPEHLDTTQFKQQFGDMQQARYQAVVQQIDQRIQALPLYQGPAAAS